MLQINNPLKYQGIVLIPVFLDSISNRINGMLLLYALCASIASKALSFISIALWA